MLLFRPFILVLGETYAITSQQFLHHHLHLGDTTVIYDRYFRFTSGAYRFILDIQTICSASDTGQRCGGVLVVFGVFMDIVDEVAQYIENIREKWFFHRGENGISVTYFEECIEKRKRHVCICVTYDS